MILVDANILVYAVVASDPRHSEASAWLESCFASETRVGLPWESLTAFVRIVCHPRIYERPTTVPIAAAQVNRWLAEPNVWTPTPTDLHAAYLHELVNGADLSANDIHDAHLAALAISHGLRVASHDGGFARFPAARWFDPLGSRAGR